MFVFVDKNTDLVVGILNQSTLAPISGWAKTQYDVYNESNGTNVDMGYTCTVNQDGTRSYTI